MRFRFDGQDRLARTLDAIDRELGAGAFHYRYTGMEREEGCFLACTFWMVEARAILGQHVRAEAAFTAAIDGLAHGTGILPEMIDPKKLPPATHPPIEDAPTEGAASDARGVSGFIL